MKKIWLFSKTTDLFLLGLPVWFCWLVCFSLPEETLNRELPVWTWVVIVICIDVSHVWSTLFRTYLDKDEFSNHSRLLKTAPLISFGLCFLAAAVSISLFWSMLAYLALYHFVKQQYGFMQLYRAKYGRIQIKKLFSDKFIIYMSMLYPVLFWHINYDREFEWFVSGDFIRLNFDFLIGVKPWINRIGLSLYFVLLITLIFTCCTLPQISSRKKSLMYSMVFFAIMPLLTSTFSKSFLEEVGKQ